MSHQDTSKSLSWTTKLSQKLKRRSTSMTRKSGEVQHVERSSGSQNPFARDYVPPTKDSRVVSQGSSTGQALSPATKRFSRQSMTSTPGTSIEQDRTTQTIDDTTSGPAMYPVQRPATSGSAAQFVQDPDDDDYLGLDMRGKARRRSSAANSRPGSSRSGASFNPFARANNTVEQSGRVSYDRSGLRSASRSRRGSNAAAEQASSLQHAHVRDYVAPPPGQLLRKSQDGGHIRKASDGGKPSLLGSLMSFGRKSGEHNNEAIRQQAAGNHQTPQNPFARNHVPPTTAIQTSPIRRKDVPLSRDGVQADSARQASISSAPSAGGSLPRHGISNGAPLPIYTEFSTRDAPSSSGSPLDHARNILNHNDEALEGSKTRQTGLEAGMQGLGIHSPEILSPESFASARDNYFEPKEGERCMDFKNQEHPTAEEIVERAKYNTTDTTIHEKMAPAVTHETIQRKVHEITEERITRDFHHYHHVHRILPVHEVEVLPAKHYRLVDGGQVEMRPEEVAQTRIDAWQSTVIPKIAV